MADQYRVNDNLLGWASIRVKVAGEEFTGFTGLSYSQKRERTHVWGTGKHHAPRGRTKGKYTPGPVKLTGPKSSVEALRARLAQFSADGASYGDVLFDIVADYFEPGDVPILVEISACHIVGEDSSEEESADPLKEEIEIQCMAIRKNGRTLFDGSSGSPF